VFSLLFVGFLLLLVPIVLLRSVKHDNPAMQIATIAGLNFLVLFVAQVFVYTVIHDIELNMVGRSLGLDYDGIWPSELTPEQEAYVQRRMGGQGHLMTLVLSLFIACTHTMMFGAIMMLFRRTGT